MLKSVLHLPRTHKQERRRFGFVSGYAPTLPNVRLHERERKREGARKVPKTWVRGRWTLRGYPIAIKYEFRVYSNQLPLYAWCVQYERSLTVRSAQYVLPAHTLPGDDGHSMHGQLRDRSIAVFW